MIYRRLRRNLPLVLVFVLYLVILVFAVGELPIVAYIDWPGLQRRRFMPEFHERNSLLSLIYL